MSPRPLEEPSHRWSHPAGPSLTGSLLLKPLAGAASPSSSSSTASPSPTSSTAAPCPTAPCELPISSALPLAPARATTSPHPHLPLAASPLSSPRSHARWCSCAPPHASPFPAEASPPSPAIHYGRELDPRPRRPPSRPLPLATSPPARRSDPAGARAAPGCRRPCLASPDPARAGRRPPTWGYAPFRQRPCAHMPVTA